MKVTLKYKDNFFNSLSVHWAEGTKEYVATFRYGLKIFFKVEKGKAVVTGSTGCLSPIYTNDLFLFLPKKEENQTSLF